MASLVFTVVLLVAPELAVPGFGRLRLAFITGLLAIAAHCWTRFIAGRPLMRLPREMWLAGALLAWAMITVPYSRVPSESARVLFDVFVKSLGVFWLLSNTVTTLGRLRMMAWVLSMASAPLAAFGAWEYLAHHVVELRHPGGGRIAGYYVTGLGTWAGEPNTLAMILTLILPLTGALLVITRRPAARTLLAGLIALDATAIVATFSRGGFLTMVAIFVLYLWALYKWREWRWLAAALALAVAAGALLPALLPRSFRARLDTLSNISTESSAEGRWSALRYGLPYILSHPLPYGIGLNKMAFAEIQESEDQVAHIQVTGLDECPRPCMDVHNTFVDFGIELGWLGLGLFLFLLMSCVGSVARVRERCIGHPRLRELSVLAEGIRLAIVAFAVSAFFYPMAYYPYFYYFGGLAVAAAAVYEAETRTADAPAPARAG